jgi:hypothetical protein
MCVTEDVTCISVPNKDGDLRQRTDQHCLHRGRSTAITVKLIDLNLVLSPRRGSILARTDWLIVICTMTDFVYIGSQWHISPLIKRLFPVSTRKLALRMKALPRSPCVKTESCASLALLCDHRRIEGWVYKLIGLKGCWKYWRITKVCNYRHL